MSSDSTLTRFEKYSESLRQSCIQNPKIIGLVLVGSTAETQRVDEWSDHDFFVITEEGEQEALRQKLTWLPNSDSIAFSFRETEHGLKVVYKSGFVISYRCWSYKSADRVAEKRLLQDKEFTGLPPPRF